MIFVAGMIVGAFLALMAVGFVFSLADAAQADARDEVAESLGLS